MRPTSPKLEEAVEVEDAGRRISLDELIEDLERTEARMHRKRTTDGHAACGSISAASAVGTSIGDIGGEQDQANDGVLDRTHDTTSMSSTSHNNEAHCDDNDDIELGSGADADAGADADGGPQKSLSPDDGKDPKGAENGDKKSNQKNGKTPANSLDRDDRRRNSLVLVIAILAVIGLAVGLGLFVKGITGLSSNNGKAPAATTSSTSTGADPGPAADVAPSPSSLVPSARPTSAVAISPTSSPVSSPTTTPLVDPADELSIYEQFGVEAPQEEVTEEEESEAPAREESGAITSATPAQPTDIPTRSPVSASPTSMPDPTDLPSAAPITTSPAPITASPTSLPTSRPSQQMIVPEAVSPTAPQLPPSITTEFSMHIAMQDVNADFFDNRSAFGKAIFRNTFDLFRQVVFTANNANDTYSLRAQSMRVGYGWNNDCVPSVQDGCPPDTVVIATFTGTSALELAMPLHSASELGSFDELVANAFAYTVSSSDALAIWVSNVKDQGIRVASTALYLNNEKVASDSITDPFSIFGIDDVSREDNVVIECQMNPIQVHLVPATGTNLLDYDLRQLLLDATLPYLSVALSNGLKEEYIGFRLRIPQNRQLKKLVRGQSPGSKDLRRSLNHMSGDDHDLNLIGTATVAGGESACDRAKDIVQTSLSGELLFLWIDEVNTLGLPVASADVTF
mmetsp:Transcript_4030/g.11485  ORF Transcript_4030/g.11485 Transcript_4030/m.11485 type:complete len:684 (+) Transcript_4030:281-2332(+)